MSRTTKHSVGAPTGGQIDPSISAIFRGTSDTETRSAVSSREPGPALAGLPARACEDRMLSHVLNAREEAT